MLLRLLGLLALSPLCSAIYNFPANANANATDNTQIYNGQGAFSNNNNPPPGSGVGRGRSLPDPSLNTLPGDTTVMFPDTSICDILLSSPNPISIDQIPFFCLCSHCKGTKGSKGPTGDKGNSGPSGSDGRRGLMGFGGRYGFTGAPGAKGQKGDQGDKGVPGRIGITGMKGERGLKGENGDNGEDGPSGPLGPQGEHGSCPCEILTGPPGVQGPPGVAGARGLPGSAGNKGTLGDKGDKGDIGLPGMAGLDGRKGEWGIEGPCYCPPIKNGTDGQKGQKGDGGNKGDIGIKGVQGDTGPIGEYGDLGMMGLPGPCSLAVQSAFSAALVTSFPESDRPVIFSRILSNNQGHYSSGVGIYIAPVNGTYVFTFNLAVKDKVLAVGLFHNFYPVLKMTETTNPATCSQRVVLHLNVQDMVWIQVKDKNTNGMYADTEMTSTFSGFLLHGDTCDTDGLRHFKPLPDLSMAQFKWEGPKTKLTLQN